jgi:hypothetical protein
MNASRLAPMAAIIIAAGMTAACASRTVVYKESSPKKVIINEDQGGPPPHAPAHGYRAKHQNDDAVLVYDKRLAVYVVSGHPDCYYSAGQYFRFVDGSWEWSVSISSGWKFVADYREVPTSLCTKHGKGKQHKEKNKEKKKEKGKH